MSNPQIASHLAQLESSSNPQQRTEGYSAALQNIVSTFSSNDLSANLIAYVQSILSDSIGVIYSRPLLSNFIEQYRSLSDNNVKIEAGNAIVQLLAPKIVSYEQQDTDLKFILADAYELDEDFTNSAKTLQTITLDSTQRSVSDDDKAKVWMRICRCYLEEDDPTNALSHLNKIKQVIFSVTDQATRLQFQLSQARISDSQRNFLDASASYLALSNEPVIDEEERLQALSAAITCAVLAPAGPQRARQLGKLYKDERAVETAEHSILEKIFLDRLLSPAEVAAFAANLKEHQLAKTSDGSTVLDKAVLEHNLLAVSRLYQNISTAALGTLLGVSEERAEAQCAAMIESNRLSGSIDQIEGAVNFFQAGVANSAGRRSGDLGDAELRAWEANVAGLAEEVEKVTTMLQTQEPVWYERVARELEAQA
ncbi:CSN4 COP9 signalosome complex subunit 4 [Neohortaea acidophila]|uniref:COP9 signalosome complex subunit 4 n=1 Tax=Neohortaea acidophila TaxID=245834 RepID=A0A6A6PLM7_9PEZI|nr:CSN4 COP9 signalosome complex subunit 4 [Neohortaea acidophila]KAF2480601.1 CSN4 COP9 signalosome complex subunit 4 [Neohortaea acidophila]